MLLKQISVYVGKCYEKINPKIDIKLYYNTFDSCYELYFNDGKRIVFDRTGNSFKIIKDEKNLSMSVNVIIKENNGVDACGMVLCDDEVYIVTSLNNNLRKGVISYYTDCKKVGNGLLTESYFDIPIDFGLAIDYYDGKLGNFLSRIDLLYNNVNTLKKVRKKKVS